MNILAFNSSPRDHETSKTELVLQKFLEGAKRAGAATETLYLRNYKINHCLGCYDCWLKTPGRCVQKDDMSEVLFDRYLAADVVVLAGPVYHATMNARMKLFVERTLPMMDPLGEMAEAGGSPHRFDKMPRVVTLSVAGYWDQVMFQALSMTWRMCLGGTSSPRSTGILPSFWPCPSFGPRSRRCWTQWPRPGKKWCARARCARKPWPRSPRTWRPPTPSCACPGNSGPKAAALSWRGR